MTCEIILGAMSSQPGSEKFDVDIPCGKPAKWYFKDDEQPTVCDACFVEMVKGDLEIGLDYTRELLKTDEIGEVLKVMEKCEGEAKGFTYALWPENHRLHYRRKQ